MRYFQSTPQLLITHIPIKQQNCAIKSGFECRFNLSRFGTVVFFIFVIFGLLVSPAQARKTRGSNSEGNLEEKGGNDAQVEKTQTEIALQVIGFESWQQPSPQDIKQQFKKLAEQYNKRQDKTTQMDQQYAKVTEAFKVLKKNNFIIKTNRKQQHTTYNGDGYQKENPHWGRRYHKSQQEEQHQDNFYDYQRLNLDQLLRDLDIGFMSDDFIYTDSHRQKGFFEDFFDSLNSDPNRYKYESSGSGYSQDNKNRIKITILDFGQWLIQNPIVLVAAFLISIGFLNICSHCCCSCFGSKEDKNNGHQYKNVDIKNEQIVGQKRRKQNKMQESNYNQGKQRQSAYAYQQDRMNNNKKYNNVGINANMGMNIGKVGQYKQIQGKKPINAEKKKKQFIFNTPKNPQVGFNPNSLNLKNGRKQT